MSWIPPRPVSPATETASPPAAANATSPVATQALLVLVAFGDGLLLGTFATPLWALAGSGMTAIALTALMQRLDGGKQ